MTASIAPVAKQQFSDATGAPLSGGKLFTYAAGTSTKQVTYKDAAQAASNTNPVILNARGECDLWLDPTLAYKLVLSPSTDTDPPSNSFWSVDAIRDEDGKLRIDLAAQAGAGLVGYSGGSAYPAGTVGLGLQSALGKGRRTGQFPVSFTTTGDSVAFGGNSAGNTFARGLQIGGGDANEGGDGILDHLDGHATWRGFWPSKNYSSQELAINTTAATLQGQANSGTNTITRLQGSATDSFWVDKKCYFGTGVFKVSAVAGDTITITNLDGSAVVFGSTYTDTFRFAIVYGTGTCNVAGTAVTRVSGDPFIIYYTNPTFNFKINGTSYTVNAMADTDHATLSASAGTLTGATFEYWCDINDQLSTVRVHGTNSDMEALAIYARYDGYWLAAQYGGYGKYRPVQITSGEVTAGVPRQQIVAYDDGRVTLGGPVAWAALNVDPASAATVNYLGVAGGATGFSATLKARGSDTNINLGYDTKGTGAHVFTSGSYGRINFTVFGSVGTDYLSVDAGTGAVPIAAQGASTNISIKVTPKGTGAFAVNLANIPNAANDAAAATAGVPVGGFYRIGNAVQVRIA